MSTITDQVGVLLHRSPLPADDQELVELLAQWTSTKINSRAAVAGVAVTVEAVEEVTVKAIARYLSMGGNGVQSETVTVDDGQVTRRFATGNTGEIGQVEILDEWWTDLGLPSPTAGAFTIRPAYTRPHHHHTQWGRA